MKPILSPADRGSTLWQMLQKHLVERLETYRMKNDGNLSTEDTIKLRGRIAEVKALLALGEDPEPAQTADDSIDL